MMTTFESLLIVHGVVIRAAFLAGAIIAGPLLLRWLGSALLDRETAVLAHVVSIGQRGEQGGRRLSRVDTP